MSQLTRLSPSVLLYANLTIGLLLALVNAAALAVVVMRKVDSLSNQVVEISAWSAGGAILALTAAIGIWRQGEAIRILRLQSFLMLALLLGLAAWAVFLMIDLNRIATSGTWVVGYLSLLAVYYAVLTSYAFSSEQFEVLRMLANWAIVPCFVAIDVTAYMSLRV